jgi:hypothetical protein
VYAAICRHAHQFASVAGAATPVSGGRRAEYRAPVLAKLLAAIPRPRRRRSAVSQVNRMTAKEKVMSA